MHRRHIGWISAAIAAVSVGAMAQTSWYPGKWGANDEIGAANYMTPALALAAARLVKTGKVYSLGITVNTTTPAFPPRTCSIYIVQPGQVGAATGLGPTNTTYNDDILNCWTGIGTQLDGLGHIGVGDRYYNGNKWAEFADMTGLKKLGVDKLPPMVARGVLLDMAGFLGVDVVKEGTPFNRAEIDGAAKKQGIEIRQGDVVIFHTGWLSLIEKDPKRFGSAEPGLGREGALSGVQGRRRRRCRHLGGRSDPVRAGRRRLRGAPDPAADERHFHTREHQHRRARQGQGLGVHVRARPEQVPGRGAVDDQSGRDPLTPQGSSPPRGLAVRRPSRALRGRRGAASRARSMSRRPAGTRSRSSRRSRANR